MERKHLMTEAERETLAQLRRIPNIGPKMAADVVKLGVKRLEDAVGRDPDERCTMNSAPSTPSGMILV